MINGRRILIKNATILTADPNNSVFAGDLLIENGRIGALFPGGAQGLAHCDVIDAEGCLLTPGFIQSHVHLTQTLFRGAAEDLALIDWLQQKIWPLEFAHDEDSIRASARLGIAELLLSGTTAILDMSGLKHTNIIFESAQEMHFRLTSGKGMSDCGAEPFFESTDQSIKSSASLADTWHGAGEGLLRYAFAPRFLLSCTTELIEQTVIEARQRGCILHTHASENRDECAAVERLFGKGNIDALADLDFVGSDVVLAHCVWPTAGEIELLARTKTNVAHCPSTNLKLASGIADVVSLKKAGINVSLGADGPPCNNRLDQFSEMRQAGLLAKFRHGAAALPAAEIFRMATCYAAKALGIDGQTGSIELGKDADLVIVKPGLHAQPLTDPMTALVYSCLPNDVSDVFIRGRRVVENHNLKSHEHDALARDARTQQNRLFSRCR